MCRDVTSSRPTPNKISLVTLHRIYLPILPLPGAEPQGPGSGSHSDSDAPPGWWEGSAQEVFNAASRMAEILQELQDCDTLIHSQFVGFCAFSAGYINLYAFKFPSMAPKERESQQLMNSCLTYVRLYSGVWVTGKAWVRPARIYSVYR